MAENAQHVIAVKKGDFLFKESDRSRDLYIIRRGQARVFKTEGGIDIELDIAGPGAVVGEISAIDGGTRSASVVALADLEVIVVPAAEFEKVAARLPDWFQKIARILVQRLRDVDGKIDLSKGGDRSAHAAALISLLTYTDHCTAAGDTFSFAESFLENELVDLLSMPVAEAVEAIDKMEKIGFLRRDHGRITVTDRTKLDDFGNRIFGARESETPSF